MGKLLACPGCGANPYLEWWDQDYRIGGCRYCCSCDWHTNWHETEEDARATWNSRVYPAKVQAVLDAAEELAKTQTYWKDSLDAERFRKMQKAVRDYKESEAKDG